MIRLAPKTLNDWCDELLACPKLMLVKFMKELVLTCLTPSHSKQFDEVIQFILTYRKDMFQNAPNFNPDNLPQDLTLTGFVDTYINSSKGYFMIAEYQKQLIGGIGFCALQLYDKQGIPRFPNGIEFPKNFNENQAVEIVKLYITPQYRSAGFGKLLVDKVKEYALQNQLYYLYLHTHPSPMLPNNAEYFWQRQGFTTFQKDNDSWQTIHMCLILNIN